MDVRIGIVQSMKELDIELPEDADREKVLADIETALSADGTILWLTDRKGRQVGVPVGQGGLRRGRPTDFRPARGLRDFLIGPAPRHRPAHGAGDQRRDAGACQR